MQDSASDSVEKYKLKLKTEDGKDYEGEVEIDTEKETETYHVPKTSPNRKKADVILDFKKVSDMRLLHARLTLLTLLTYFGTDGLIGEENGRAQNNKRSKCRDGIFSSRL